MIDSTDIASSDATAFDIRLLTPSDIRAAMRLKELARWNQTESDWMRLVELEPEGCFAAFLNDRLVATTTTTTYDSALAWIGMVLVDPDYRRRGMATRLMKSALDYLKKKGVATIKLDATPAGRPVYEALGFVSEAVIERWQAVAQHSDVKADAMLDDQSRQEMFVLDRRAFGADRARLLDLLHKDSSAEPLMTRASDGRLGAYCLTRRGAAATYIGPLVASDKRAAIKLLDAMLDQLAGESVYIDFHTGFRTGGEALIERGFTKQRDLIRMRYGTRNSIGTSELVFAIAGPEIG